MSACCAPLLCEAEVYNWICLHHLRLLTVLLEPYRDNHRQIHHWLCWSKIWPMKLCMHLSEIGWLHLHSFMCKLFVKSTQFDCNNVHDCLITLPRLFGSKAAVNPVPLAPLTLVNAHQHWAAPWPHWRGRPAWIHPPQEQVAWAAWVGRAEAAARYTAKPPDLCTDSPASSPASGLSLPSNARPWPPNLSSSSAGSKDTLSCHSMTSLHTSSESIDLPLPHHHGQKVTRTGSVKSTLSEGVSGVVSSKWYR